MRIVFEGLPGAGKTTLASYLAQRLEAPFLQEWVGLDEASWRRAKLHLPHYQANDQLKHVLASYIRGTVIIDGYCAGALAFAYAQSPETYAEVLGDYQKAKAARTLRPPGLQVYLDLPAQLSHRRQPRAGLLEAYENLASLEKVQEFYQQVWPLVEPEVPRLSLDAQLPLEQIKQLLWDGLKEHAASDSGELKAV